MSVRHQCRVCCLSGREGEDEVQDEGRIREMLEQMPGLIGLKLRGAEEKHGL